MKRTFLEAKLYRSHVIDTANLLLCILRNKKDSTTKLLQKHDVNYDETEALYKQLYVKNNDLPGSPT